jgi:hypothetical protein
MNDLATVIELPFTRLQELAIEVKAKAEGLCVEDWILKAVRNELMIGQLGDTDAQIQALHKL